MFKADVDYEPLHRAMAALAAQCDGAQALDQVGFAAPDARLGHLLAALPASAWPDEYTRKGWEMLRKYRVQLASYGIDYDALPVPPVGTGHRKVSLEIETGCFIVISPYSDGLGPAISALPGAFPVREPAFHWKVGPYPGSGATLLDFARAHDFVLGARVASWAKTVDRLPAVIFTVRDGREFGAGASKVPALEIAHRFRRDGHDAITKTGAIYTADPYPHYVVRLTERNAATLQTLVAQEGLAVEDQARAELAALAAVGSPPENDRKIIKAGTGYLVSFPYDPGEVDALKRTFTVPGDDRYIPALKWNPGGKNWIVREEPQALDMLLMLAARGNYSFVGTTRPEIEAKIAAFMAAASASSAASAEITVEGMAREPFPFQKAGIAYAVQAKRVFLADQMGLGKTLQAIGATHVLRAYPVLVICPASLKLNWQREWGLCFPGVATTILAGKKPDPIDLEDADVVIINYDIVPAWTKALKEHGFKALVCDESHFLKNGKALRTKAVKEIAVDQEVRLLLSGTPLVNRPVELVSQLDILGRLEPFGGSFPFLKRYCGAYKDSWGNWNFGGADHLDELNQKLRATCYVRRLKSDVMKELPPKVRSLVPLEITNRAEYERAQDEIVEYVRGRAREDAAFAASIADLLPAERRLAMEEHATDAANKAARAKTLVLIETLKQLAAKGKMTAMVDWVESFIQNGEKLILFAHHQDLQHRFMDHFPKAAHVFGEDSGAVRQENVDRFQNDPDCTLIVCSLRAAGVGITLTAASNVAFAELGWTPGEMDQSEDRAHRIGQHDSVTCWYLLGNNTIDMQIAYLLDQKRAVVTAATDGGEAAKDTSVFADLIKQWTKDNK